MTYEEWGNGQFGSVSPLATMYADWTADRETMAKVYAAGMGECEKQVDALIERCEAAEAELKKLEPIREWAASNAERYEAAEAELKRLRLEHDYEMTALDDARKAAEAELAAYQMNYDQEHGVALAAEKDAAYQRRHRKSALKEMRTWRRLCLWNLRGLEEQRSRAEAAEAERDWLRPEYDAWVLAGNKLTERVRAAEAECDRWQRCFGSYKDDAIVVATDLAKMTATAEIERVERERAEFERNDLAERVRVYEELLGEIQYVLIDARGWCPKDSGAMIDITGILNRLVKELFRQTPARAALDQKEEER